MIADANVKNRVMIDIINEPDARGLRCVRTRSVHAILFYFGSYCFTPKVVPQPQPELSAFTVLLRRRSPAAWPGPSPLPYGLPTGYNTHATVV